MFKLFGLHSPKDF